MSPSMSDGCNPASVIAARHASSVRLSGSMNRRRPVAERPMPLMTMRFSIRSCVTSSSLGNRSEYGQVDVIKRAECDLERHAVVQLIDRTVDDVRQQAQRALFDEFDERDDALPFVFVR